MNRPDGWYPSGMGKIVTLNLDDALIADFERAAADHGRSLEAEIEALIRSTTFSSEKDGAALLRLSDAALARTMLDERAIGSDSAAMIRADRDAGYGNRMADGEDHAGR